MQYVEWAIVALVWFACVATLVWRKRSWPLALAGLGAAIAGTFAVSQGSYWLASLFYVFAVLDVAAFLGARATRKAASS